MKKILILILMNALLMSCSKNDEIEDMEEFDSTKFPQKWELVKMTGQLVGSEQTGEDMQWQEFYLLKPDSTFTRCREEGDDDWEESGRFSIEVSEFEELLLTLTYNRPNNLVGSCIGSKTKEVLSIRSNNKMQNTWIACDGPGMEYERVE